MIARMSESPSSDRARCASAREVGGEDDGAPSWIDTHCHLDAAEFDADRDAVIERARAAGIAQIVVPAVDAGNFARVRELAHRYRMSYALGIHPMCTDDAADGDLDVLRAALEQHRYDPRLVAVGEIGLDHFIAGLDRERQARFFSAQLALAAEFELPVLLHVRRAVDTVLKHLRRRPGRGGIAHAFNGSEQQAEAFIALGFRLGFGGAVTFDRALKIRRVGQTVPIDAIVMETDGPDIAPQWLYRTAGARAAGAAMRNESAELARIGAELATLRGVTAAELAAATSANALRSLPRLAALMAATA